ncbi:hypothetical protein EP227_07625 [bacterium]|nr:MAG: hypothetical protein EP227_07625 [bacterium]
MITHSPLEQCSICKHEYTSIHVEAVPGIKIFVCESCLEAARYNFIWICMNCGKVYLRPKKLVMSKITDIELKKAYLLCEDMQIIQGMDMCIDCDPEGLMDFMENAQVIAEC